MQKLFRKHPLGKMAQDRPVEISMSGENAILGELLDELNEDLTPEDLEYSKGNSVPEIRFTGDLVKHHNSKYREFAILRGDIFARFLTLCVGTGTVMLDEVEASIKAIFIEPEFESEFGYEEETSIYLEDGQEYELYYLSGDNIEIQQALREALFLNKNPYPRVAYFDDIKGTRS